ncbi:hypothetical protein [Halotalea alkalilenta]|uniref:hypothetical protein n=1 Tax=Halotalea alkalilenta TaxID=376489 RepID=UPI0004833E65|nr:hypothetical protein [Halotalea alkalilenta]
MTTYRVFSEDRSVDLLVEAENERDALNQAAREKGYSSHTQMCRDHGEESGEAVLKAVEVEVGN